MHDTDGLFTTLAEIYPDLELAFEGMPSKVGTEFERVRIFDDSDILDSLNSISLTMDNTFQKSLIM